MALFREILFPDPVLPKELILRQSAYPHATVCIGSISQYTLSSLAQGLEGLPTRSCKFGATRNAVFVTWGHWVMHIQTDTAQMLTESGPRTALAQSKFSA